MTKIRRPLLELTQEHLAERWAELLWTVKRKGYTKVEHMNLMELQEYVDLRTEIVLRGQQLQLF